MVTPTVRRDALWALALSVLALVTRALTLLVYSFDGLYGQDPFAYYDYAVGPLRTALASFQPWPPTYWPPGYPLLIVAAGVIAGSAPPVAQWVSLLCGAAVPALTYLLAREVWAALWPGEDTGHWAQTGPLLAGLLAALNPQLWQSSIVVMADAPGLAAATLGAWALARYVRNGRAAWLVVSGGALAYAVLTRWAFALPAIPIALVALARLWALARTQWKAAVGQTLAAALVTGLVLSPLIGSLLSPPPADDFRAFAVDLDVYTWNPANALRREFVTADGLLSYRFPNGLYYGLLPLHPYYFTPLLALFLLPGLARLPALARSGWRARRSVLALGLLGVWPLLVLGFHAGAPWQNFRFGLAALPPLAILAAAGVGAAARWRGGRVRWPVAALTVAGLAWMAYGGWQLSRSFILRKDGDLALVAAVEAQTPPNARLLTFGQTLTFKHYSRLDTHELWALTEADLAALLADPAPTYLLLDVANAESQWAGRAPEINYHWLRDGPGLVPLGQSGEQGEYQLFVVKGAQP